MARRMQMDVTPQSGALQSYSGVTLETWGDKGGFHTRATINSAFPDIAGGAALAVSKSLFDLPAGEVVVEGSSMSIALQHTDTNVAADTPDMGLGTGTASGANATLDAAGAGAENLLTGQTVADVDGAVTTKTLNTTLVIAAADGHTVKLNLADTWAASGDDGILVSGTVDIFWRRVAG